MDNWLKKFTSSLPSTKPTVTKIKPYFRASCFWARDSQSIARGMAAGLAGAVIPGFQFFYAAVLVTLLRGNLPVALLCTFITNPFTVAPITYLIYWVGTRIIANGGDEFVIKNFIWDFSSWGVFWANMNAWILQFGKSFLIGLPIVSLCFGLIGYFGTLMAWKIYQLCQPN